MTIGVLFGDLLKSLFKKPATQNYPYSKIKAPERLRGKLVYDPEKCIGCMLCIKDCPSNAIELITVDKINKRFVLRYHPDKCVFCAQCVENCRFKCLSMSNSLWEMASTSKEAFEVYYGREEDIAILLERAAQPGINEPSCEE
ncbi:MAG: 4Fe-4S dicluster domain-containing protein [Anaerolineaceae bacterium]|nr:4Fe-4S dicluster domain-containing protein [Anaerolineaceae bacterium]